MHARLVTLTALAALTLTATAAGALDAGSSLRFGFVPQRAFQGQPASLSVMVRPSGVRCAASVRYADATLQRLPSVVARAGRASWRWEIPAKVKTGSATAAVSCGKAGKSSRAFTVAGPPSAPARVVVLKNGFSQRVVYTTRRVSFGAELSNPSPENDALGIDVQVNFIDATNRVVQTEHLSVAAIGAGTVYYLGGSTNIPDATPVSKLEVVTRIGGQKPEEEARPRLVRHPRPGTGVRAGVDGRRRRPGHKRPPNDAAAVDADLRGRLRLGRQHHWRRSGRHLRRDAAGRALLFPGVERRRRDPVRPRRGCKRLRARHLRGAELEERFRSGVLRPITSA